MLKHHNYKGLSAAIASILMLSACGGGSDSEEEQSPTKNSAPTLVSSQFTVNEDSTLTSNISVNDADNDSVTLSIVTQPQSGELTLTNDGQFTYIPQANYNGSDSFVLKANDGSVDSGNTSFNITISPVNDAPTVAEVEAIVSRNTIAEFTIPASDIDGDELTFQINEQPKFGAISIEDGGKVTYTPTQGMAGQEAIEIAVSDGTETVSVPVVIENNLAYQGRVAVDDLAGVEVFLTSSSELLQATPGSDGSFKFYTSSENFAVKAQKSGYKSSAAKFVSSPATQVQSQASAQADSDSENVIELEKIEADSFIYHWEEDQSTAGTEYSANVNQPIVIEFLDQELTPIDQAAADKLRHDYNIILVDTDSGTWSQEHAYRILETMKSIPQLTRNSYKEQVLTPSKWQITQDFLQDDITISETNGHKTVTISSAAFANATPKLALADGRRGIFYSQRLHHALVRYVTNHGQDKAAVEKILNERFGISSEISSYSTLTENTTKEGAGRFQQFHSDEMIRIINMFEEMPKGMHKLEDLKYLARRLNGTPHPLYPTAAAVAWPTETYIEFMESAFTASTTSHVHRLIIHEKAHFLWANHFDDQLKQDWIELGGWYQENDQWFTSKQTEFVSAYSHSENPNEDMAETIAFFVVNPDKLRSRSIAKYEFVRDRIMQGSFYLSQIREDLQFEVYNLYPDYVFPGKIKRIDITVDGAADEDKTVNVEIELHALDTELEGAQHAYTRIFSETGTYKDLYMHPVNGEDLGTTLRGSFTLSKLAKAGYWRPDQIVIADAVGNERYAGTNDFGWKLFVNNSLEDLVAPQYVADTAALTKTTTSREGQEVQIISAQWSVDENTEMADDQACYASMNDQIHDTYRVEEYGSFNPATSECHVQFVMPHYMPSSTYEMNYITMMDKALNKQGVYFTQSSGSPSGEDVVVDETPQSIELLTNNPDLQAPTLDLNNGIDVTATPVNPTTPNGETEVTITFKVRDNISGYNIASLQLRDPQGIEHHYWAYNDSTWTLFPTSDPTEWQTYQRTILLPAGSAPGTWGVSEMTIYDRAGNFQRNDFTEIVHFDVIED